MSRSLSAEMQAVADAEVVRPIYLIDMDFPSGAVRIWSGSGLLTSPEGNTVIINGDYTDGLNDWTVVELGTGTVAAVNDTAVLTSGTGFTNRVFIHQTFNTVAGQQYAVKLNHTGLKLRVRIRNALTSADILPLTFYDAGDNVIVFTATSNSTNLHLRNQVGGVITIDSAEVYAAEDYVGAGDLLSISEIEESADLKANGASVTLTGIKTSLVQTARDEDYQGRKMTISLGAMNEVANVIASPAILFTGFMDVMTINDGGDYSTINVTCENKLIAFERSNRRRNTDGDQRIDYPTDEGFSFVTNIVEKEFYWGQVTPSFAVDKKNDGGYRGR
jgi:hypothetical protein